MSSPISVKLITWSVGKNSESKITDWLAELRQWTIISSTNDIIFITLQEVNKKFGSETFLNALKSKLNGYRIFYQGEGPAISSQDYYVFGYLCVKNDGKTSVNLVNMKSTKLVDSTCIYKNLICMYPTIGFGYEYDGRKLIFVASTLPMNPNDNDYGNLGYSARIDAMKKIDKEVIQDISKALQGLDTIFWLGNMNFRVQTDGIEQLDDLLSSNLDIIKGFREANKNGLQKSCKYLEYNGLSNYEQFVMIRQEGKSFNKEVIPSYCDRIIYKGLFTPLLYYSYPKKGEIANYPKSIAFSTHEPVVLEGVIPILSQLSPKVLPQGSTNVLPQGSTNVLPQGSTNVLGQHRQKGGENNDEYYRLKYYKYKAKYMSLKN
ncbi:MAG: hypothetical protein Barrevirus7_15 [Barrevirus sp.]|uniref:Inositol polyphosphate-related phosphatase domain-containing protein n=1 Tax=Barrevirus sp. TaxID=2487763 RepID=A0A3G4ZQ26_9VIRU|nr:MAG: hypothetical protein Barrevirus7_15 [Barrevirus sp.]